MISKNKTAEGGTSAAVVVLANHLRTKHYTKSERMKRVDAELARCREVFNDPRFRSPRHMIFERRGKLLAVRYTMDGGAYA